MVMVIYTSHFGCRFLCSGSPESKRNDFWPQVTLNTMGGCKGLVILPRCQGLQVPFSGTVLRVKKHGLCNHGLVLELGSLLEILFNWHYITSNPMVWKKLSCITH